VSTATRTDDLGVVLELRTSGGEPPLFCIHPGFALCWAYAVLLRSLGRDLPVYGIQARGIAGDEQLPATFDDLTTDYLELISAIQPRGPYRLLGWSFGGLAAHALATALQARGERVELLAMMDTILASDFELSSVEQRDQVEREFAAVRDIVPDPDRLLAVVHNLNVIRAQFSPSRFEGDVLLFTAAHEAPRATPIAQSWLPHVTGRTIEHRIACDHLTMMTARPAADIGRIITATLRGDP
jgi:thioesterase domain-containing protein